MEEILQGVPARDYSDLTGHYGAEKIVRNYCSVPHGSIPGVWQHGPFLTGEQYLERRVSVITDQKLHTYAKKSFNFYVARSDMTILLKKHAYKYVYDIGLPFIYLPKIEVPELPNSVLFFPAHSSVDDPPLRVAKVKKRDFSVYSGLVNSLKAQFKYVGICIHGNDYSENVIKNLKTMGFDLVVVGAEEQDANSLYRIQFLISSFQYIISDTFSSSIVYAAYLNKRISIVTAKHLGKLTFELAEHEEVDFLRLSPDQIINAKKHLSWGALLLGLESKQSPGQLSELFYFNRYNKLFNLLWRFREINSRYSIFRDLLDFPFKILIYLLKLISKIF
jgi:hypothetical protein